MQGFTLLYNEVEHVVADFYPFPLPEDVVKLFLPVSPINMSGSTLAGWLPNKITEGASETPHMKNNDCCTKGPIKDLHAKRKLDPNLT